MRNAESRTRSMSAPDMIEAGRPGEEEEGEEEDRADVILEVRPHLRGPGRRVPAEAAEDVEALDGRAVVPVLRPALLEAAVDVPAEVVEGRRDDGDREDVLHRRRHHVLASRGASLVRHEADVDQPHDHDGPEVELLGQDQRVEVDLGVDLLGCWCLGEPGRQERRDHSNPLLGRHRRRLRRPYEAEPRGFHVRLCRR